MAGASFKDDVPRSAFLAPSGYYVVMRPDIGRDGWVVKVYNFATWKHREARFADEATAHGYYVQWTL